MGILLILLGIFTFIRPESMLTGLVVVYGVIAVITGIGDIMAYVKMERYIGFGSTVSLVSGVISVMSGVMLLIYPHAGIWILSLLFPVWSIAHCISRLSHMNAVRMAGGRISYYFALAVNIIGIILGVMMVFRPLLAFMTLRAMGYAAAVCLILLGIDSIVAAVRQR